MECEIIVKGQIEQHRVDWLDSLTSRTELQPDGTAITHIYGSLADQSALQGILAAIGDLNLELISVATRNKPEGREE